MKCEHCGETVHMPIAGKITLFLGSVTLLVLIIQIIQHTW
jgi:ribosomal protein S27E